MGSSVLIPMTIKSAASGSRGLYHLDFSKMKICFTICFSDVKSFSFVLLFFYFKTTSPYILNLKTHKRLLLYILVIQIKSSMLGLDTVLAVAGGSRRLFFPVFDT